jgi:hypothetical protein
LLSTAEFVGTDTTTQSNWRSAYSGDGYDIAQDSSGTDPSLPSYAQVSLSGQFNWTWPSGYTGGANKGSGTLNREVAIRFLTPCPPPGSRHPFRALMPPLSRPPRYGDQAPG